VNYIFFSPNFPSNFKYFVLRLRDRGVNVFGIGSDTIEQLDPELRSALKGYYRVDSMEDYHQVYKAVAYFVFTYGRIDRYESHNEYWLEQDAAIRTDFNIPGLKTADLHSIKQKSKMKDIFRSLGIPVAKGQPVLTLSEAKDTAKALGYPVLVKPDKGVGAAYTYKIENVKQLTSFFNQKPPMTFIMEEFINGDIETFDGLTDASGNIIFVNSFVYNAGVMDAVNKGDDMYYYTRRKIPADLQKAGTACVKAYKLKERFFHFEFFRLKDGSLMALEINVRPPGGLSMDMFNFTNDEDLFDAYARVILEEDFKVKNNRHYHVFYIGLKDHNLPALKQDLKSSLAKYKLITVFNGEIASIFAPAIGNYAIILRHPDLDVLKKAAVEIMAKKESR
jgi:hypothetical protein